MYVSYGQVDLRLHFKRKREESQLVLDDRHRAIASASAVFIYVFLSTRMFLVITTTRDGPIGSGSRYRTRDSKTTERYSSPDQASAGEDSA